jgi:hypothetical protein
LKIGNIEINVAGSSGLRRRTMNKDPYEIAIDQILAGAGGDVRLALRTVLIQNIELEAKLHLLAARIGTETRPVQTGNSTVN